MDGATADKLLRIAKDAVTSLVMDVPRLVLFVADDDSLLPRSKRMRLPPPVQDGKLKR